MPQNKRTKKIEVRDLKPGKDAKGGVRTAQGGPTSQLRIANLLRETERARVDTLRAR